MHEVDHDVVVMYALVKMFLMFVRVMSWWGFWGFLSIFDGFEYFEGISMVRVFVIFIRRNSNIFETRALPRKPRSDSESATSIT